MSKQHLIIALLITLLSIGFRGQIHAQTSEIDSLESILGKHVGEDTIRVNLLNDIGKLLRSKDPEGSLKYLTDAVDLAERLDFQNGQAKSLYNIGVLYRSKDWQKAIDFFQKSLVLYEAKGDHTYMSNCLINIGLLYRNRGLGYDKTLEYLGKALAINEEVNDQKGISLSLINIGVVYKEKGDYQQALQCYERVLSIDEATGDEAAQAHTLINIGEIHELQSDYPSALNYYHQAMSLNEQIEDDLGVSRALTAMGIVYRSQGNYPKALHNFQASLRIFERLSHKGGISHALNNLGIIHWYQEDHMEALDYWQRSLQIKEELQDQRSMALSLHNIAGAYAKLGDDAKALDYYHRAMKISENNGNRRGIAMSSNTMGGIYLDQGDYPRAIEYLQRSLKIAREIGAKSLIANTYYGLGKVYLMIGTLQTAEYHAQKGYDLAHETGQLEFEKEAAEVLSKIYERAGQFEKAYQYHVIFKASADSLNNEKNTRTITRLQAEFDFEQEKDSIQYANDLALQDKNSEIFVLEEKESAARVRFVLLALLALVIIGAGYWVARTRVRTKALEARKLKEVGQFKEAMTGMIAHDLKSPLSIILNSKDVDNNQQVAQQMLQLVNNMLDVHQLESDKMTLEVKAVDLSKLLFGIQTQLKPLMQPTNLTLTLQVNEIYTQADEQVLERVLMNLLTNAIKFSPANGEIKIMATATEDRVRLAVQDQGKGIAKADQPYIFGAFSQVDKLDSGGVGSTGLGLTFCKLAVEAHGSKLMIDSEPGKGATFYFDLSLVESATTSSAYEPSVTEKELLLSEADKRQIADGIKALKVFNLYQIGEIEKELSGLKQVESPAVEQWVEEVLNAAYAGNKERYGALMEVTSRNKQVD